MIDIAILGHGVVGSGVVEVLLKNHDSIAKKTGEELAVRYILDLREFPDSPFADRFVKDFSVIEHDPAVRVVVECMGGMHPAYEFVTACLRAGKHVVTSNKELVAAKGDELIALAGEHHVNFLFEASVGGGIPIIRPLSQCLAANEVYEIAGILNGTTNFILTKMIRDHMSFDGALAIATQLGYVERDPSADIDGHDTCRKICILASLTFGKHVYPDQIHTEGISKITLEDVDYATTLDGVIKLIGWVKKLPGGKIALMVSPAVVSRSGQLAGVEDVFNAVLVRGDAIGDVVFYGKGAGKLPTASAVVADVIDCAKHLNTQKYVSWGPGEEGYVEETGKISSRFYCRLVADDPDLIRTAIGEQFGEVRYLSRADIPAGEVAFVTEEAPESALQAGFDVLCSRGARILGAIRLFDY